MEIGIDIGGTKIAAGRVHKGRVLQKIEAKTPRSRSAIIALLQSMLGQLDPRQRYRIGIGVPGSYRGTVIGELPNIPAMKNVNLARALGRDVVLVNDARAFAYAQHMMHPTSGMLVGVIVGTGLGTGIIINGVAYHGRNGMAGEFGHMIINPQAASRNFSTRKDDWESILGGRGIARQHQRRGGTERSCEEIWASKSARAMRTRREAAQSLAVFLANMQHALDPEMIIVGGGLAIHTDIVAQANKLLPNYGCKAVAVSKMPDAGIIGASRFSFAR